MQNLPIIPSRWQEVATWSIGGSSLKGTIIEELAREHLLSQLSGFTARKSLVYRRPFEFFLCGISFETSSFSSDWVAVTTLLQPLYVPQEHLIYTLGFRLGDYEINEGTQAKVFQEIGESAKRDALPFFDRLDGLDRFCTNLAELHEEAPRKVPPLEREHVKEALAYAELLRGQKERGLELLRDMIEDASFPEPVERAQEVIGAVSERGLEAGQALLHEWRAATARNLKLRD
jgi:hypothetical protein